MSNNTRQNSARFEAGHLEEGLITQEGTVLHIGETMLESVGEIVEPPPRPNWQICQFGRIAPRGRDQV
jgi:hypothetical protein